MAWKASKGSGTDPAAREGHFKKAASGANNSNNTERMGGRSGGMQNQSSMIAFSPSDVDSGEWTCLRPGWSGSWTKVTERNLAVTEGLTANAEKREANKRGRKSGLNKLYYP